MGYCSSTVAVLLLCLLYVQNVVAQTWTTATEINSGDQGHDGSVTVEFNGVWYVAFCGSQHGIWLYSSTDNGTSWSAGNLLLTSYTFNGGVTLVVFGTKLYAITAGSSWGLCVIGSSDGSSWPSDCTYPLTLSFKSPSAAVLGNTLYVSVSGSQSDFCVVSTTDLTTWSACNYIPINATTRLYANATSLSLTYALNNQFYFAVTTTPSTWVSGSFSSRQFLVPAGGPTAPSLAVVGSTTYAAFQSSANTLYIYSNSGSGWQCANQILTSYSVGSSPSLVAFGSGLAVVFSGTSQYAYFAASS